VAEREIQVEDQTAKTLDPDFWDDRERAELISKELKENKRWIEIYLNAKRQVDDAELLLDFQKEGGATEEEVEAQYRIALDIIDEMEFQSTLNKPEDALNCILEINAGAGGTEACDWVAMLYRMYQMYATKNNYRLTELDKVDGDTVGIKSVTAEIMGDFTYGLLKGENGVHRLVRISPFNAQGKRMTSFASVFVHPMIDESITVDINPADLEWDTYRAQGAGGQHVNKTESAVRVRHVPSGVVVTCQKDRSQIQNRETAMKMLRSRLYELELQRQLEARDKIEAQKMKNEWGSQIRSYVLDDRRVKDHRTNYESRQTDLVLNGGLDEFLKAYLMKGAEAKD
jgi:peptide chain release factor 2